LLKLLRLQHRDGRLVGAKSVTPRNPKSDTNWLAC
jgi:hypothetical protein